MHASMMAALSGPMLPILLLAIPIASAVVVVIAGLVSRLRPSSPIPRAAALKSRSHN